MNRCFPNESEDISKFIHILDKNNDDVISFAEFMRGVGKTVAVQTAAPLELWTKILLFKSAVPCFGSIVPNMAQDAHVAPLNLFFWQKIQNWSTNDKMFFEK